MPCIPIPTRCCATSHTLLCCSALPQVAGLAAGVRNASLAGYLVRARADADTIEARAGFTGRRDAIIAAGPQVGGCSKGGRAAGTRQLVH